MISVLLPSHGRPDMLLRCIRSIADTAASPNNFEICLRLSRDDPASIAALPEILKVCTVRVVIGLWHNCYESLSWFYQEAHAIARGEWVWFMNDDGQCKTPGWDSIVLAQPRTTILMSHTMTIGPTTMYTRDKHNPFFWLPNHCWEQCGMKEFGYPIDAALWQLLRKHGWQTTFIPVELDHDHHDHEVFHNPRYRTDPHERVMKLA